MNPRSGSRCSTASAAAGPRLTKAGEALYTFAVELLRRSEETTHALDDLRKIDAHEIAIAVHRDLMSDGYSVWLATFAKKHPKAKVVTRIGTIEDVVALMREREVTSWAVSGLRTR